MTQKALNVLSKDEDGFFLMVEGGQIDWAGHSNDAGTMLHELLKFDEAIQTVYEWAKDREDTIVIVTADHETGSFGFSYSSSELPKPQKRPGEAFTDRDYAPNFNFGAFDILDGLYNQKQSYYGMISEYQKLDKAEQIFNRLAIREEDSRNRNSRLRDIYSELRRRHNEREKQDKVLEKDHVN